ncbi:MAG TPA: hypothetical protein EYM96_10410, partial [Rhodospirillales bacterium]|nr:hypothetical protein [Rhodospirillales bacterium]
MKDQVPTVLYEKDPTKFYAGDHSTCAEWYRVAVQEGFIQHIQELFPRSHLLEDFVEVDYDSQLADLYEKYNNLDDWLHTDSEAAQTLITALAAAGDIAVVIDQKVAAEAALRTIDDDGQKARLTAIESNDWVTTQKILDNQVTAAKCAADVATQVELETEKLRLDAIESNDWVTTQKILDGQVTAAKCAADVASQAELETEKLRLAAIEAGDWVTTVRIQDGQVTAAKCAADVASQAELDAESTSRQQADSTLTSAITVEKDRLDTLFLAGDVNFDTIKEITEAFSQVQSTGLSVAISSNTTGVAQNVQDIQTKQGTTTYLNNVNSAQRSQAQLEKLDATSNIQGQFDALSSGKQVASSYLDYVTAATRSQAQLEKLDATSNIQGQFDALSSGKQDANSQLDGITSTGSGAIITIAER